MNEIKNKRSSQLLLAIVCLIIISAFTDNIVLHSIYQKSKGQPKDPFGDYKPFISQPFRFVKISGSTDFGQVWIANADKHQVSIFKPVEETDWSSEIQIKNDTLFLTFTAESALKIKSYQRNYGNILILSPNIERLEADASFMDWSELKQGKCSINLQNSELDIDSLKTHIDSFRVDLKDASILSFGEIQPQNFSIRHSEIRLQGQSQLKTRKIDILDLNLNSSDSCQIQLSSGTINRMLGRRR